MAAKFKNPYLQVTEQLIGGSGPKNPYLQHGWGNSAKAKQKEKEYNRKYYEEHKKDKWGVGVGSRLASAPKENKLANGLKRFGQSVNESLQKHNDNWQRGMDMILNKNVTSQTTPASTMQKKKVNPYTATGMANNERSKAEATRRRNAQAARANAYAQSEQARQLDTKHKANSRAAQTSRANAYAQNEMSRRANQDSDVIRSAQRAKEGARMQEDIQNKLMAQYGRQKYEEEMSKAAKDKQQKQYQSEYLNAKNTKEKMANESYAQANAANRNRAAKLDKQIEKLTNERNTLEGHLNNESKWLRSNDTSNPSYKANQHGYTENLERRKQIDSELKKLTSQRDALVDRHNGMVDTANTYNASRDTTKENYEKNSKEHAAVTKKINDYNNKIAKAASQYEEAKQHVTSLKGTKDNYANGDVWANHKMRWEDEMRKAADDLDKLMKQRDALKKKQQELADSLR